MCFPFPILREKSSRIQKTLFADKKRDRLDGRFRSGKSFMIAIAKIHGFVKSPKMPFSVIPVKTGILSFQALLDSRLSGSDDCGDFLRVHQNQTVDLGICGSQQESWSALRPLLPRRWNRLCSQDQYLRRSFGTKDKGDSHQPRTREILLQSSVALLLLLGAAVDGGSTFLELSL